MIRLATLADSRFAMRAANLAHSVQNSTVDHALTIFCDHRERFAGLRSSRCDIIELPEIQRLGAKRAKLTAFVQALTQGDVIFLDADAILMESLAGIWGGAAIRGCRDGLEYCPFIPDKLYPWPGDPQLTNRRYINSGGFFAPSSQLEFFEYLQRESLDDSKWQRYTIADCLYDNHFLCAYLNLCDVRIEFADPLVYGWRGFLKGGELQVTRRGSQLLNVCTGTPLALILFAGTQQTPELLRSLPPPVASLIFERIAPHAMPRDEALAAIYATASPLLGAPISDPAAQDILGNMLAELPSLMENCGAGRTLAKRRSYFRNPEAVKAFAYANPSTQCVWNGLQCGGAYIDAGEYRFLRRLVQDLRVRTVLETGAGETSILFRNLGVKTFSVEYQDGPWLERAARHGCDCAHVPFDFQTRMYREPELGNYLRSRVTDPVDLLLIDSPTGTRNREHVLTQMLSYIRPRFVAYHDAFRDAPNILRDQLHYSLRLVGYADAPRGLAVYGFGPAHDVLTDNFDPAALAGSEHVKLGVCGAAPEFLPPRGAAVVRISLENAGSLTLSSRYQRPVLASYHWLKAGNEVALWDGVRTPLPCDLDSGDRVEFDVDVIAPAEAGIYRFQPAVVQEGVCWLPALSKQGEFILEVRDQTAVHESR